ncbi:MAG: hypothetical protein E6K83_00765 [Thaumarchaeota archaeon]|nr:MAG: hypothetical protein E6K83_00765 [Nitrososphaerota archaeon]
MSDIRVTYSGLIALAIGLSSVFTGMIFTLIVTRRLTAEEFGIWSIMGSMISYFLIAEPVISFWSTRQIARGEKVGKTSIMTSFVFSFGTVPLYIALSFFVSNATHQNFYLMILGAVLLPVTFVSQTVTGINLGHKPHANSYGLLAFESIKIPSGLFLVYFLDLGVNGAIITTLIAYIAKIFIQIYFAKTQLRSKFVTTVLKRWLKLSWIPIYSNLAHVFSIIDIVAFSIITSSVKGVAYYSVSNTIAAVIANAGLISQAIYPKLLAKGAHEHAAENFTRLMYFAIPLLGITTIFSKPALFALNPIYAEGSFIVVIISFRTFFYVLTSVLYQILMGIETIDLEQNPRFANLAKSKIFFIPTLQNIQYFSHIVSVVITVIILHSYDTPELELVKWWAIIGFILQIPFFIYAWILVQKHVKFPFPSKSTLKYVGSTTVFTAVFFLSSGRIINYQHSIYDFLPRLILELSICVGIYILVTFMVDKKTRILLKAIFTEFTTK